MTLQQWLTHLSFWLRDCPLFQRNPHISIGIAGGGAYTCILCGYVDFEDEAEDDEPEASR